MYHIHKLLRYCIIIKMEVNMNSFKIPIIPSTSQRSIRFPDDLIEDVENAIKGKQTTFTAFVVAATRHAIDELKNTKDINKE